MDAKMLQVATKLAKGMANVRRHLNKAEKPYRDAVSEVRGIILTAVENGVTEIDLKEVKVADTSLALLGFAGYSAMRGLARQGRITQGSVVLKYGDQPLLAGEVEISRLPLPAPKALSKAA